MVKFLPVYIGFNLFNLLMGGDSFVADIWDWLGVGLIWEVTKSKRSRNNHNCR